MLIIIIYIICVCIYFAIYISSSNSRLKKLKNELDDKFEKDKSELKDKFEKNKFELKNKFEKRKFELKNKFEKRKFELKNKFEKDKSELKNKFEKDKSELKNKSEKRKSELISDFESKIAELENEIAYLENEENYKYTEKITTSINNSLTSDELKNELSILKLEQKELIQNNKAIKHIPYVKHYHKMAVINNEIKQILGSEYNNIFNQDLKFSNTVTINKKFKQILGYFESECNNIFQDLKFNNIDKSRNKIIKIFDDLNNIFKTNFINLSNEFLNLKLEELNFFIEIAKKQQEEKETKKAIREQMIEEEKARREIEKEKIKIAKEEKQFNNEISKMLSYLQKSNNDIEKQIYIDKIKELEEKLKLLEKDKENVLQREINTRAGFVYIISNIGSFGENVFKIGMTRRLDPMERIYELSSASVPFPFDVHAIIFSDDAPSLENSLHKYFEDKAINRVNLRKEFFKIDTAELQSYVLNLDISVNFIDIPEAKQYRQSLKIIEDNK